LRRVGGDAGLAEDTGGVWGRDDAGACSAVKRSNCEGGSAVSGLVEVQNANRSFRLTGSRKKFIDDFNALRASSYGFLKEYLHSHPEMNLPADFASQFFRKGRRNGPATVDDLDVEIATVEKDLASLRDQRSAVFAKQEAEAKVKAESDMKVKERLIAMAKSAADEAMKRLQALQSKI